MSYIEQNIMVNEHVVYIAKIHWITFKWPILLVIASVPFLFFGKDLMIVSGVLFVLAIIAAIPPAINRLSSEFGITNKRVIVKVGFIRRTSLEVMLSKIEGILVDQSLMGRILNYGSITINGTGGTRDPFNNISHPLEFRKKAQEQILVVQEGKSLNIS